MICGPARVAAAAARRSPAILFIPAIAALAGCSSDAGPASADEAYVCYYVAGSVRSRVDSGCPGCAVTDEARAIDGDIDSFASLVIPATGALGQVAIRAIANAPYAAGERAGAIVDVSTGSVHPSVTVRTFLGDQPQESMDQSALLFRQQPGPATFVGFTTTQPFDAIEISVGNAASLPEPGFALRLREFCYAYEG